VACETIRAFFTFFKIQNMTFYVFFRVVAHIFLKTDYTASLCVCHLKQNAVHWHLTVKLPDKRFPVWE